MNMNESYMHLALEEAKIAQELGEIPIGAVGVINGEVIARAGNRSITHCDPSAHAEMQIIRQVAKQIGNYRLNDLTVVVTIEPCVMCMGALIHARIGKLVFGAYNSRGGACGSDFDLSRHSALNHHIKEVQGGVLEAQCAQLMRQFFRKQEVS